MKKAIKKFVLLFIFMFVAQALSKAQCYSPNQSSNSVIITNPLSGTNITVSSCEFGGSYAYITFNITGVFSFSTDIPTDYITITDNNNNDIAFGTTPLLSVNITNVGLYKFHISPSGPPFCGLDNTCRVSTIFGSLSTCSGLPNAGTVPSSFSICPNTSALINVTGASIGSDITYQWQESSSSGGPYTNVTTGFGFNTPNLTTDLLINQTFYQLVVTCTASGLSSTSGVVSVNPNNPTTLCYCTTGLGGAGCGPHSISNVSIPVTSLNNNSGCNITPLGDTYSLFYPVALTTATLDAGLSYQIAVTTNGNDVKSVWIDYDQSGTFDASEHTQIGTSSIGGVASFTTINVPISAIAGQTGMRIRSSDNAGGDSNGPNNACTSFGSGGECEDYIITINPAPPCSGTPASNLVISDVSTICSGLSANLSLATTYTESGLTFQWESAPSIGGPYVAIPNATLTTYITPSLSVTTWYQCVVTCTASLASTTATPVGINVVSYTNTVPYFEGFEGISANDELPNCSWVASSPSLICLTYTATTGINNQQPNSGAKFASFRWGTDPSGDYFYTNGIQLNAGTTYSASAFYISDGFLDWSNFSLLYGTSQSTTGLVPIASVTGTITNTTYSALSNVFTVPTSGIYFIAVKCIGGSGGADFSWDDLSIIDLPPCAGAPAANTVVATSTTVCSGGSTNLSFANTYTIGGLSYQWASATSSLGPFTAIPGATLNTYALTNVTSNNWFNCVITCAAGPASTTASPVEITVFAPPVYAAVPFLETFDNTWEDRCDTRNVPVAANWDSSPTTGVDSWRRQDDGASAYWTIPSFGIVSPLGGFGGSANFYSFASYVFTGNLDLYVDMGGVATNYDLSFYHINQNGADNLQVFLSTDGGATFTLKDTYLSGSSSPVDFNWNKKVINFGAVNSTSCIVRFTGTSETFGASSIGIDSVQIFGCVNPTVTLSAPSSSICSGSSAIVISASGATNYIWDDGSTTSNITVSPTVTTTYTVIGTNPLSCFDTETITITVIQTPSILPVSDIAVCAGKNVSPVVFTTIPGGLTTSWVNSNTSIGLGSSGIGNIWAFTASNVATTQTGVVQVFAFTTGCLSTPITFNITAKGPQTSTIWTGAVSADFSDSDNWTNCSCAAITDATIAAVSTPSFDPIIFSNADVNNLTINASASLSVLSTETININGDWVNDGTFNANNGLVNFVGSVPQQINGTSTTSFYDVTLNNPLSGLVLGSAINIKGTLLLINGTLNTNNLLTLYADASGSGRIGPLNPGSDILNNVNVQQYANGGSTGWALLGSPVEAGITMNDWNDNFAVTCPACTYSSAGGVPFTSVYSYDETVAAPSYSSATKYIPINSPTDPITHGLGYWVYLGNGYPSTTGIMFDTQGPVAKSSCSTCFLGPIQIPISKTTNGGAGNDGWNLISNPLPSPISFSGLLNGNANVNPILYAYNADLSGGTGAMATYALGTGISVPAVGSGGIGDAIPMCQGFYVEAINNTSLSAPESIKIASNQALLRSANSSLPLLRLYMNESAGNQHDEIGVCFVNGATAGFDGLYDARKFISDASYPMLAALSGTNQLNLSSLPSIQTNPNQSVPLIATSPNTGVFTFSLSQENFPSGICVELVDNLTNTTTNILTTPYTCTLYDTTTVSRFTLNFKTVPMAGVTNVTQPSCVQPNGGSIVASGSVGAPWDYVWKNSSNVIVKTSLNVNGSDSIVLLNGGSYFVSVNSVGTCNTFTQAVVVNSVALPISQFTASSDTVYLASGALVNFTNASSNATNYFWSFGDGNTSSAPNPVNVYSNAGVYYVKLQATSSTFCNDSSSQAIVVLSASLGINSISLNNTVLLQNKNFNDYSVNIKLSELDNVTLVLTDINGKLLLTKTEKNVLENELPVSLRDVDAGVYLLNVRFENKKESKVFKLIKY
jgi:hypothetical protein